MKNIFLRIVAIAFLFTSAGCLKGSDEEQKCNYDPCAFKAPAGEVDALRQHLAANNITATEHCSGLFYIIENPGTGKTPEACYSVAANYKGMLLDGSVFDQSTQGPITFGLNRVIRGWTNGLPLIKQGGRIILYIPPSLGYGAEEKRDAQGVVRIPANSNLVFEVDLVAVQ
jgi:FKBP-type peptidyl-prolyl cis-trans isomerase FkpA